MNRKDAWSTEEDQLLIQTIINTVKEGGTQIEGIKQGSDLLARTEAACGYRFNAILRKEYAEDLKAAKEGIKKEFIINGKKRLNKSKEITDVHEAKETTALVNVKEEDKLDPVSTTLIALDDVKATLESYIKENADLKEQLRQTKQVSNYNNKTDLLYEFAKVVANIIEQDYKKQG